MNFPRPKISTVLICMGLFFFFLLLRFPFGNLRGYVFGKIYKETGISIVAEEIYPSLFGWPGIGIINADITLPGLAGKDIELSCKKLIFRVGIGGLFPPVPSVSLTMKGLKRGGDLYVKFVQGKTKIDAQFDADGVVLDQIALGVSEPISGKLTAEGAFSVDNVDATKSTGQASLSVDKLKIPGQNMQGFILPVMNVGDVQAKVSIKNGLAEINRFQLGSKDSDLAGAASGDIRLSKILANSFLTLNLKLQLSDRYRQNPQSETLVAILNSYQTTKPGEYSLKWAATFNEMQTNLVSAIPQKGT